MADKIRFADLNPKRPFAFDVRPSPAATDSVRTTLDLLALRKVRFEGTLKACGTDDWELKGRVGATVVQPCAITLEPVTTRIEEDVYRMYLADWVDPDEPEVEMSDDDASEPLPSTLDLIEVTTEVLALALPLFPRAEGAELGELVVTEPNVTPLTREASKPFAGLADLKKRLEE